LAASTNVGHLEMRDYWVVTATSYSIFTDMLGGIGGSCGDRVRCRVGK
jgi:hypothetical protein